MRNVFTVIRKFIAFLLSVFATLAMIFVIFFLSFNRNLLTPQTYKQALSENEVYEQLPAVIAEEFALIRSQLVEPCAETVIANSCLDSTVNDSHPGEATETVRLGLDGSAFINGLNQNQWNALVTYLLTAEDVQKSLDAGIHDIIAYFKGETDSAGLPLLNLKTRLTRMTDEELNLQLLNSQPPCTLEQQTLIMSDRLSETGSPPVFCSGTGGTSQLLVLDLQRRLSILAEELPERITFIKAPSPSNPPRLQRIIGRDLQITLQRIQVNSQYLPLLPVALLVLMTIFGVRSLRGLLRWWGIPIFLAGLFALIMGMILFFMFDQIWLNYVLSSFPPLLTSGFGEMIYGIAHSLSKDVSQHLMIQAAVVTLLALGILLISNRVPAPPDPSLPPLAPPGTPGGPVLNPERKKKKW